MQQRALDYLIGFSFVGFIVAVIVCALSPRFGPRAPEQRPGMIDAAQAINQAFEQGRKVGLQERKVQLEIVEERR